MNENSDIEVPILSLDFKPEYQVGGMSERSGLLLSPPVEIY